MIDPEFNHINGEPIVPETDNGADNDTAISRDDFSNSVNDTVASKVAAQQKAHTSEKTSEKVEATTPQTSQTLPQTGFASQLWLGVTTLLGGAALLRRPKK